jgi:hypothetical protein
MKTFVTVLQTSANNYEVRFFNGETSKSIYPEYRNYGIAITILEATDQNVKYCHKLIKSL